MRQMRRIRVRDMRIATKREMKTMKRKGSPKIARTAWKNLPLIAPQLAPKAPQRVSLLVPFVIHPPKT